MQRQTPKAIVGVCRRKVHNRVDWFELRRAGRLARLQLAPASVHLSMLTKAARPRWTNQQIASVPRVSPVTSKLTGSGVVTQSDVEPMVCVFRVAEMNREEVLVAYRRLSLDDQQWFREQIKRGRGHPRTPSAKHMEVFKEIDGLSDSLGTREAAYAKIADREGKTIDAIRKRWFRALDRLTEDLK